MPSRYIFIVLIGLISFVSACRSVKINQSAKIVAQDECILSKKWLERRFAAKNILKIDREYEDTLFIIVFKKEHSHDAEKLSEALQKLSSDIYMTKTPSFYQIYLSAKTAQKLCQ